MLINTSMQEHSDQGLGELAQSAVKNSLLCNPERELPLTLPAMLPPRHLLLRLSHFFPYPLETALPVFLHINCRSSSTWFTVVPTACWEVFCAWEQANTQDSQEEKGTADGLEQCPELNVWCRVGTASLLFYWFLKLVQRAKLSWLTAVAYVGHCLEQGDAVTIIIILPIESLYCKY